MLMNPLQQIGNVINVVQRARASLDRLNDLLGKQADIKELPGAKELNQENPGIEVRDLSFSYEDADGQEEGPDRFCGAFNWMFRPDRRWASLAAREAARLRL